MLACFETLDANADVSRSRERTVLEVILKSQLQSVKAAQVMV